MTVKVPYWELWIRSPLMKLVSWDEGKTWKGCYVEFFPFVPAPFSDTKVEDVSYLMIKSLKTN